MDAAPRVLTEPAPQEERSACRPDPARYRGRFGDGSAEGTGHYEPISSWSPEWPLVVRTVEELL